MQKSAQNLEKGGLKLKNLLYLKTRLHCKISKGIHISRITDFFSLDVCVLFPIFILRSDSKYDELHKWALERWLGHGEELS